MNRLPTTAAVMALTLFSAMSMNRLVHVGLWFGRGLVCLLVVAAAVLATRALLRSDWLPSLVGVVVGAFALAATFASSTMTLVVLPTSETWRYLRELVAIAMDTARQATPPIAGDDGVALLMVGGVVLVYVFAELLAVGANAPAWAGLPVLGLWTVPVVIGSRVQTWVFVAAGLSFLVLLALRARASSVRRRRGSSGARRAAVATTAVVAASMLTAVLAAPGVLHVPSPVRIHTVYDLGGSNSTRLDLGLDLRDDLTRDADAPLVTYEGVLPGDLGPLQAYTLTRFNGSTWERTDDVPETTPVADQVLWPTEEQVPRSDPREVSITIMDLAQDRLLVPGEPRVVEAAGEWSYDPAADEVVGRQTSDAPFTYAVDYFPRDLDPARLGTLDPRSLEVDPALLALPDTGYAGDIGDIARQVVDEAGATNAHEELVALQNFLRDDSRFTYTDVIESARTTDAVWDFLNDRHGYCVQFATAMVIMARTLDLPARIAIGFLPGEAQGDGTSVISSHRAHAWPQVLFPEVGWVRFEPTPSLQSGSAPAWAPAPAATDPTSAPTTTAAPATQDATTAAPTTAPTTAATSDDAPGAVERGRSNAAAVVSAISVVVVALAGLGALRRHRMNRDNLETHWSRVLRHLDRAGFDTSPSLTPRAIARAAGPRLEPSAAEALTELAHAVEIERYARSDAPPAEPERVREWTQAVVSGSRATTDARGHARV